MPLYKETKYRTILTAEKGELDTLRSQSAASPWKPGYHIHPQCGLLNDPNGLAYFNREYHVFYQWYPFDAIHGLKHWAHVKSKDLVHWERLPVALLPVEEYESHGAYSGASIEVDGKLYLFYTGNIKYSAENRSANQCVAIMGQDGTIEKYEHNPVIKGVPEGYTGHVRDPKVFKQNGHYYMMLGAQREDLTGTIIVYESTNALDWSFKGELSVQIDLGSYMWECPDYFQVDGKDVLVFSPQGIKPEGHSYQNVYNVVYAIGSLDIEKLVFQVDFYQELEKGFDFYAPQTFVDENNKRVLFAWAGSGEISYPTDCKKWAHCLTIPRELKIKDNKLYQKPAEQLKQLRLELVSYTGHLEKELVTISNDVNKYELELHLKDLEASQFGIELFSSNDEGLVLEFDRENQVVSLNRERFKHNFGSDVGFIRSEKIHITGEMKVQLFVDHSIAEIFVNDGEVVFTTRVFPLEKSIEIKLFARGKLNYNLKKYKLSSGISI